MSLVAADGMPLILVGGAGRQNSMSLSTETSVTLDAALEAIIYIGHIFTEDGSSHTIDTTGSSSLGWRTPSGVVFANGGTSVSVGLAAVDSTTGPPARAVNSSDTITFDVAAVFTGGGGGITNDAWQESVPTTGSKTIANGDLVAFAVQMTTRGGVDVILARQMAAAFTNNRPVVTTFTGAAYANSATIPNAVITFSDGVRGYFYGGGVESSYGNVSYNSGSGTNEYGNYFQMPVPTKVYGIATGLGVSANCELNLYSNPFGTPVAEKTISIDANQVGATTKDAWNIYMFAAPYTTTASQPLVASMKATAASPDLTATFISLNSSAQQKAWTLGTNGYAVNRGGATAFAQQSSGIDRFSIGLLVAAFSDGVTGAQELPILHIFNNRYRARAVGY